MIFNEKEIKPTILLDCNLKTKTYNLSHKTTHREIKIIITIKYTH